MTPGHFSLGHIPSDLSPPEQFPSPPSTFPLAAVKAKIRKLALAHTPDPNRHTARGPDPNRPMSRGFFEKMALTRTPDPNGSTAINFVHVND